MLTTVEAEIDVNGKVELLEEVCVKGPTRAIVTLLGPKNNSSSIEKKGNSLRDLLADPIFQNRQSYPASEIDAQIEEARNSWD